LTVFHVHGPQSKAGSWVFLSSAGFLLPNFTVRKEVAPGNTVHHSPRCLHRNSQWLPGTVQGVPEVKWVRASFAE